MVQRVLDGQQPAPRLPVEHEVVPVQPERLADLLHLVDEAVQLPQRRLVRLVAVTGAELVVVVVLDPRAGQVAVARLQVLVRRPGPAVQEQHPQPRVVADPLHPHPVRALRRVDAGSSGRRRSARPPGRSCPGTRSSMPPEACPAPDRIMPVPRASSRSCQDHHARPRAPSRTVPCEPHRPYSRGSSQAAYRGRATPALRHAYAYVHERCRGRPAVVASGARQRRGPGAGSDRRAALRLVRRGPSEHHRLLPGRASPAAYPCARAHPRGRGVPGAHLAAPLAGRGARCLGGRRDDLHPARLRQRRGAGGPDGRPVHGGRPDRRPPGGGVRAGNAGRARFGQHRGQPARAVRRGRGDTALHDRRGGGRRDRGGQPACLRGLHPRPGRTGRPPPPRRGTAAHRPRAARRRGAHHGHHQRAGRGGRARPAHPPGGGRRIPAGDQDREQGGAAGSCAPS